MPTIWLNINAKEPCNEENLYFDILAQPTKFPTIFSQSNGFRLTRLNEEKSGMIKKNSFVSEKEEEEQSGKGKNDKLVKNLRFIQPLSFKLIHSITLQKKIITHILLYLLTLRIMKYFQIYIYLFFYSYIYTYNCRLQ